MGLLILRYHRLPCHLSSAALVHQYPGRFARCEDYPSVISGYLGKNWGFLLGILYFLSILICVFMYSTALTNDSASFLYSFGVTDTLLSDNPFYGLAIICAMVVLASRGEQLLFRISTLMVLTKLLVVICLGGIMIQHWNIANIGVFPDLATS